MTFIIDRDNFTSATINLSRLLRLNGNLAFQHLNVLVRMDTLKWIIYADFIRSLHDNALSENWSCVVMFKFVKVCIHLD
jgi:hypothetical protein